MGAEDIPIWTSGRWVLVVVLVCTGLTAGTVGLGLSRSTTAPRAPVVVAEAALEVRAPAQPSRTQGLAVLRRWDARRARAWATGDLRGLRRLYTDQAESGRADRAMLRRWIDRGLVVESLETQVRGVTVVTRSPRRLVVVVTDRIAAGFAVQDGRRTALPQDRWSTRRITFRRLEGRWVVANVRPG